MYCCGDYLLLLSGQRVRDRKKNVWEGMGGGGGEPLHWQVQGSTSSPTVVGILSYIEI